MVETNDNGELEQILTSVRAQKWDEFVGQMKVRRSLEIAIEAARRRKEAMDHTLLYGPPGLGKTTLAHLIAKSMKSNIRVTSGPALERSGDLASILSNLEKGDVLFIDEIHRLNKTVEEMLYPAMEDYALDMVLGKGPAARTLRLELNQFTIVGATTRAGLLSAPLRDRFGVTHRLSFYNTQELQQIVQNAASKLGMRIEPLAAEEIAKRARKTARVALKLLRRVRDLAEVKGVKKVDTDLAIESMKMLDIDELGLDEADRRLLGAIIDKHDGGPVGLDTLAALISEDVGTIEDVNEPYLLRLGLIKRTHRGRVVTPAAYRHLKRKIRRSKK